jgi:hypothetical protein
MSQEQPQRRLEQWSYFFRKEDGVINILIGLIAMVIGLMVASDKIVFWLIFYILGIGIWRVSEKWINYPGKDCIKSSDKGVGSTPILIGLFVALLFLVFILGFILVNLKGPTA